MMTAQELKKWFASEEFNREYTYEGHDLGASYTPEATLFKLWAPMAEKVGLKLYAAGDGDNEEDGLARLDMVKGERGVWLLRVERNLEGVYYTYLVTVDGVTRETGDPYAKACGINGHRSMVVDLAAASPEGWQKDRVPAEIEKHPVIWELHIKDFSHDSHSGVREEWRGRYLAFTEKGTSLDGQGDYPTCMEYLKKLGVTYVHLMPAFDYGSVDEENGDPEQFNWGYDPVNYNVPEGSYATDAADGHVRIREFKAMVMALHEAGIGVIMDVVFNHTYAMDSVFGRTVPGYYYRMYEDGIWANGSGCGDDTASERAMFGRYMADSICYWAQEYHIDGFRFDLMALHDIQTMNEIRARLDALPDGRRILMYGEPWSASGTAWENGAWPANMENLHHLDERIAVFCDKTRDTIKGSLMDIRKCGYVSGSDQEVMALKGDAEASACAWCGPRRDAARLNPRSPRQIVSYVSAHDDLTLWDKLVVSVKETPDYGEKYADILQMNRMAAGMVMTAMGIPFFMAGEEFGRTKKGCGNSYNKPASLNMLDWRRARGYKELVDYYRFLIALRRNLPLLDDFSNEAADKVQFIERRDAVVAFMLEDKGDEKPWKRAAVLYNPYDEGREIAVPEGSWLLLSDGVTAHHPQGVKLQKSENGTLMLKARSVTILGEKNQ